MKLILAQSLNKCGSLNAACSKGCQGINMFFSHVSKDVKKAGEAGLAMLHGNYAAVSSIIALRDECLTATCAAARSSAVMSSMS